MTAASLPSVSRAALCLAAGICLLGSTGCRQKMAEAPMYKPYEASEMFSDGRSARPLERGVIHRGQYLETDPLMTGFTREEWGRIYSTDEKTRPDFSKAAAPIENREQAVGSPRFDPPGFKSGGTAHAGPQIYVNEYPFKITEHDLKRGQERFTIYCAVCHGPLGNGQGKIWERGYLTPTSFHTEKVGEHEVDAKNPRDIPLGYSRGYALWGIKIPMREVPIGYIFEVISRGYGGMPSYSAQIAPADRWRIIAYVRTLQFSQYAPADQLPPESRSRIDGGKP
jgi:mono/diheme cytochrome c family protein